MKARLTLKLFLVLATPSLLLCQELRVKIYDEDPGNGEIRIYADNQEPFPVSVQLKLELKGLKTDFKNGDITVLNAFEDHQQIAVLQAIPGKPWNYRMSSRYTMGDVLLTDYDTGYIYELPFEPGYQQLVSQGYLGLISHDGVYAIDFNMPEGTHVHAMRPGTVVKVVDINNKSCPAPSCMQYNNVITVLHADGTFADYAHLKQSSAKVGVGDRVETGSLLAESGKTGWTTGPHLHVAIFLPAFDKQKTFPTKFRISEGKAAYLQAGMSYRRT